MTSNDLEYLRIAKITATKSNDPSTKVGSLIVDGDNFVSVGYNHFPDGVAETDERMLNRELKYEMIIHAEEDAIINAHKKMRRVEGATMYLYGLPCCSGCAKRIIQSGIKRLVYVNTKDVSNWNESNKISQMMFDEVGLEVLEVDIKIIGES